MRKNLRSSRTLQAVLGPALVALCSLVVWGQSGRRARTAAPSVPAPTPEATPTPTPAEKPKPAFTFIVGIDKFGDISRVSLNAFTGVVRNCADRLDDASQVKADVATRDLTRADAIRQAKAEKEAYVVWLQLRATSVGGTSGPYDNPNEAYVEYSVFAPTTAKQVTSGNVYAAAYRNKQIRVPTSSTNGDYYLNQAARGAAERILDHFHIRTVSPRP
jgi:hypothetical protein